MPRRPPTTDPELRAHQEWLGYLQPVGLVVAPAAMVDAGWVVTRSGSDWIGRQDRYRQALEPLGSPDGDGADGDGLGDESSGGDVFDGDGLRGFRELERLLVDQLGWQADQLGRTPELIDAYSRDLPELGETLKPSAVVAAASGEGAQLLVWELPLGLALDQKQSSGTQLWRASPQERFERLLRDSGVEAGLLFNGSQLRLVVAPKGESSGHLTFPLADLAEVGGRLMGSGLELLLGQSAVFFNPAGTRLGDVLKASRHFQAVVSNALADQVLAALWDLLRGIEQADQLSQRQGGTLLGPIADSEPQQLYGGLITVLMRLVFLLYAEDEALMPSDPVYEQNYKVSGIFERLQQDAAEYPDTMDQRYGAWAGLMSLCRLVFAGGGPSEGYLPARKGQLFDPAAYRWLDTPWISDGVVLSVLSNLLVVKGERISYRALDVEQIGSVYEGIMGYAVRRLAGRCIGLKSKPQGAKKQITTAVDLDALLELPGAKRKAWLEEEAGTSLPPKAATALKEARNETDLLAALAPRLDRDLFEGPEPAGSLVFQPTEERRRSGSHYTPRSLTRPIVAEALRPWLERTAHQPSAEQILALKICDPAMGSGAFLVESCRFLAELLEQAWSRDGLPQALQAGGRAHGEEPLLYARRLIAQGCLYGVDKNPFAVNLARLSLWLVSLSKDAPFTFVDHALQCGDSLVGIERSEIEKALKGASRQREIQMAYLDQVRQQEAKSFALFHADSRSDADDAQKRQALDALNASTAYLRTVGDLLVAAFFNGKKPNDREELKQLYLEATLQHSSAEELEDELAEPLERLRQGEKGITPLHWELAFPDVFGRTEPGFDVFVGNPPFLGGIKISGLFGDSYLSWLQNICTAADGNADLCAYFFRRSNELLRDHGAMGFISTNTICQGDTRRASLSYICSSSGFIYSAAKRMRWPGVAAVRVSSVHAIKDAKYRPAICFLNGKSVHGITPFLLEGITSDDPRELQQNQNICFSGATIVGDGFILGEEEALKLLSSDYSNNHVLKPFLGGQEMNDSPTSVGNRYIINFGTMELEEAGRWPELLEIARERVKPERDKKEGNSIALRQKKFWWRFRSDAPFLKEAVRPLKRCLALCRVGKHISLSFQPVDQVFGDSLRIFAIEKFAEFGLLQCRVHEAWARFLCSSFKDDLRYSQGDCFDNFPFPAALLGSGIEDAAGPTTRESLEAVCELYHQFRTELMVSNNEGLTSTYNRCHDPAETSSGLLELRRLHEEMDQAMLAAYGWSNVPTTCGFGLDYLDLEDDAQLPDALQERIDSGELFFWDATDALDFQGQLQAYGAITGRRKLPWRYRWPDAVRDDVLARLLALNAERYAEEVALGLHSKGGKKTSKAAVSAGGAKKRGRPSKATSAGDSGQNEAQEVEQMGLGL